MTESGFEQQVTFLYTHDLEATAHFYGQLLGLPLVRDQGDCRIFRVSSGAYIGFCARPQAAIQTVSLIVTLVTPDVEGWYERLRAAGVAFEQPPQSNPRYAITHCFLRDPNGYLIEIQRFDEPLP
ncbi:MAG: hypothetical protein Kow0077_28030 [Anaerolineae bacterium]